MAKPCTPHPIPQAEQFFKIETANVGGRGGLPSRGMGGGRGGTPLVFLWGIQRGNSLLKDKTPFGAAARTPLPLPR